MQEGHFYNPLQDIVIIRLHQCCDMGGHQDRQPLFSRGRGYARRVRQLLIYHRLGGMGRGDRHKVIKLHFIRDLGEIADIPL